MLPRDKTQVRLILHRLRIDTTLHVQGYKYYRGNEHRPHCVSTRKEMKIRENQRTQRWVSTVREHMVQDKRACGEQCKEEVRSTILGK